METSLLNDLKAQVICFNTLAAIFDRPVPGVYDSRKYSKMLIQTTGSLKPKACELAKKIHKTTETLTVEQICSEYDRLFNGNGNALAPPFSEHYNTEKKEPSDGPDIVREYYIKAGFTNVPEQTGPDHITTELRFLGYLIDRIVHEFEQEKSESVCFFSDLRCRFVNEHMISWVTDFTRRILYNSKSPFYLQLAIFLRTIIVNCPGGSIYIAG